MSRGALIDCQDLQELTRELARGQCDAAFFESLKVCTRDRDYCERVAGERCALHMLVRQAFPADCADCADCVVAEAVKCLINIATNAPTARATVAELLSADALTGRTLQHLSRDEAFLIARLCFLVTIEEAGGRWLRDHQDLEEWLLAASLRDDTAELTDDSPDGRVVIEVLRVRYNQARHGFVSLESAAAEAHCVLRRTRLSMDSLNIVGSVVNVSMARGPKDVCFGDDALLVPCLRIAVEAFCDSSNGDYLPSILLVVFERVGRDAQLRGQLRRTLLPSGHRTVSASVSIAQWRRMLMASDTNLSWVAGELLLALCEGRKDRLIRHVGFEHCAGYLYAKGGMGEDADAGAMDGDSSDEEYFAQHPPTASETVSPEMPQTEEEERELEMLMDRIAAYNARISAQK